MLYSLINNIQYRPQTSLLLYAIPKPIRHASTVSTLAGFGVITPTAVERKPIMKRAQIMYAGVRFADVIKASGQSKDSARRAAEFLATSRSGDIESGKVLGQSGPTIRLRAGGGCRFRRAFPRSVEVSSLSHSLSIACGRLITQRCWFKSNPRQPFSLPANPR